MKLNDEVIYTILVTDLTSAVKRQNAHAALTAAGVPKNLRHDQDNTLSVPRMLTYWRGDDAEDAWQTSLKTLGNVIIDVHPWSLAPGYPIGDTSL